MTKLLKQGLLSISEIPILTVALARQGQDNGNF